MPDPPSRPPAEIMMLQTLKRVSMFSGLPAAEMSRVLAACRLLSLKKDEVLFHEGSAADGFFIVHSGAISVHRLTPDGREQVIRVFYPCEAFAEVALVEGTGYPASACAIEESQVILVRRSDFRLEIHRDPDLALRILASFSTHLKFLVETIEDLKLKQAESRVAQWLLRQSRATGNTIELPLAKRLLASQLGLAPETFSRILSRWREAGLVEVVGPRITLRDPAALEGQIGA